MFKLNYELRLLQLSDIDLTSKTYLFSFPERKPLLIDSIRELGLITPPLLYPSKEMFQIVSGEGRIKASLDLGWTEITALVIKEPLSPKELLLIALESNLGRGLNLVEKALFLEKAQNFFDLREILNLLPRMGFSSHPHWIFYLQKINLLEEPFKRLLAEERLNHKIVEDLSNLTPEEREEFLRLLLRLNLTLSEQREVLQSLLDYQKREGRSGLVPESLESTLKEEEPQLRKRIFFETLNQLRYPHYYQKKRFLDKLKKHFQGRGIQIDFSPYLEKREITFTFRSRDPQELEEILKSLQQESDELFRAFE